MDTLPLVILYTAHLRGNLDLLPRLQTLLHQLKIQPLGEDSEVKLCPDEPDQYRILLLDLGESCSADAWHCAVTGGRSTLLVLDAMGYDAANVAGFLSPEGREKLSNNIHVGLVDGTHPYQFGDVRLKCEASASVRVWEPGSAPAQPATPPKLQILLQPGIATRLDNGVLALKSVQAGQVGVAHLTALGGTYRLAAQAIFDLSPQTPPDATISATVEFVVSEARYYQRKQS
jgi:hypothetical protein